MEQTNLYLYINLHNVTVLMSIYKEHNYGPCPSRYMVPFNTLNLLQKYF